MLVKGDPRTTAVQEAQKSAGPDGNRRRMAPEGDLQGDKTDGYTRCLNLERTFTIW